MAQAVKIGALELKGDKNDRYYLFPDLDELGGITHATSTRDFGNEETFYRAVGIPIERVVRAEQVHRDGIGLVTQNVIGKKIPGVDALITNVTNIPLSIRTADCIATIFYDPKVHALGIAHAGWRGTFGKIVEKTIAKMGEQFGATPHNIFAALSPSIGGCCYSVTESVLKPLRATFPKWERYTFAEEPDAHLDLKAMNRDQLLSTGVPSQNIFMSLFCTSCMNDQFFSYRKEGIGVGRLYTVAMLI